jgi:type III secretion protein R
VLAILTTSFSKIVIVLSILRQALGTPQAPPNMVIVSLALVLTCFSMYPVWQSIADNLNINSLSTQKPKEALELFVGAAKDPIKNFLYSQSQKEDKQLFLDLLKKNQASTNTKEILESDFIIVAPAFLISQLALAFKIGFLIYLPFVVIDMTIANLLMALGMQMLSPTTISIPFKLMLFVLMDGWRLLAQNLVKI